MSFFLGKTGVFSHEWPCFVQTAVAIISSLFLDAKSMLGANFAEGLGFLVRSNVQSRAEEYSRNMAPQDRVVCMLFQNIIFYQYFKIYLKKNYNS